MKTVNADATIDNSPTPSTIPQGSVASIVNVPNQIAVTVCWVVLGMALGYYLFHPSCRRQSDKTS